MRGLSSPPDGRDTMSERDELAETIASKLDTFFGKREFGPAEQDLQLADALLAAGYRKPRTVTTAAELDALPVGSVVLVADRKCGDECAWQLFDDVNELRDEYGDKAQQAWASAAYKAEKSSADVFNLGPAIVLHEGSAS